MNNLQDKNFLKDLTKRDLKHSLKETRMEESGITLQEISDIMLKVFSEEELKAIIYGLGFDRDIMYGFGFDDKNWHSSKEIAGAIQENKETFSKPLDLEEEI